MSAGVVGDRGPSGNCFVTPVVSFGPFGAEISNQRDATSHRATPEFRRPRRTPGAYVKGASRASRHVNTFPDKSTACCICPWRCHVQQPRRSSRLFLRPPEVRWGCRRPGVVRRLVSSLRLLLSVPSGPKEATGGRHKPLDDPRSPTAPADPSGPPKRQSERLGTDPWAHKPAVVEIISGSACRCSTASSWKIIFVVGAMCKPTSSWVRW